MGSGLCGHGSRWGARLTVGHDSIRQYHTSQPKDVGRSVPAAGRGCCVICERLGKADRQTAPMGDFWKPALPVPPAVSVCQAVDTVLPPWPPACILHLRTSGGMALKKSQSGSRSFGMEPTRGWLSA